MAREHWFFIGGALVVIVPLMLIALIKKLDLLEPGPDEKLTYTTIGDLDLRLHLFRAENRGSDTGTPALVLFHGGGWRFGSAQQFYPQCQFFASQGITCISAEYRLGPTHQPDIAGAIQDAAAALDHVRTHAAELGVDKDRIYAGGGSSGGHLAAALGAGIHGKTRERPAALLLYNPVLDLSPCTPANYLVDSNWQEISPLHRIDADFPDTLILSGSEDREVTPLMVDKFCSAVRQSGGNCDKVEYAGQHHGFFNPYEEGSNPFFDKTNREALRFLTGNS